MNIKNRNSINSLTKYHINNTSIAKAIVKLILIFILLLIFWILLQKNIYAKSGINIETSKEQVKVGEEFSIAVTADNIDIAAYTIWMYFDTDKAQYTSEINNLNVIGNKIIYTWFSENGKNVNFGDLTSFKFKAKDNGIANFSVIGEFYNQKGEKLDIDSAQIEVKIGEDTKVQNEETVENFSNDASDSSLEIMRLNHEGISPNFDKNIKEYYLVVDNNIQDLDVTAIAANKNAKVDISGNKNLKEGLNEVKISVTSADGTSTSNYLVNVTKTNNEANANANLETLAVEYYTISPEFGSNITNYSVEVSKDTNNLNILAIPENFNAKVTVERK